MSALAAGKINGAQAIIACLELEDVDTVFSYPGGAVLSIFEALRESKQIKNVLTRRVRRMRPAVMLVPAPALRLGFALQPPAQARLIW